MEEYNIMKYTISKLIDKLTWAEHTAGALQAENDRLKKEVEDLAQEVARLETNEKNNLTSAYMTAYGKLEDLYKEKTGEEAPFLLF